MCTAVLLGSGFLRLKHRNLPASQFPTTLLHDIIATQKIESVNVAATANGFRFGREDRGLDPLLMTGWIPYPTRQHPDRRQHHSAVA
jgi:hypothetical protein